MTDTRTVPSYVRTDQPAFVASLSVDRALAHYDVIGSIAHVEMLGQVQLLTSAEVVDLTEGLRVIAREVEEGSFPWQEELEDVHTNIEVRLTTLVGSVGGKLHTGRSRNDQVALDERLWARAALLRVANALVGLEERLLEKAAEESASPMPGFTHLQRAQVVTVGHWLLAHFWRFDRDLDRLFSTAQRADVSPLGAGALAGSTLGIDPDYVARRLGFDRAFENSMDAVSDRDPLAELLFDLALVAVHASGLGEEVVLFASKEFGFLTRNSSLGSGSSLMPQKQNPDIAELVRGKTGRAVGDLVALLTTLKGLPLSYNRDLQEDKPPVFDSVDTVLRVVQALEHVVPSLEFQTQRLRELAEDPELYATDVAERRVARGEPFRSVHESVGRQLHRGDHTANGPDQSRSGQSEASDPSSWATPEAALERRASPGGPSTREVARQLSLAQTRLVARKVSLSSLGHKVGIAEEVLREETK